MRTTPSRVVLATVLLVLGACSGTTVVTTAPPTTEAPATTTLVPTTTSVPITPPIDPDVLAAHVALVDAPDSGGAVMAAVFGSDGGEAHAVAGAEDASTLGPDTPIRIASISKILTALVVLGLVDEGRVGLDATASDYVTRVAVPDGVRVRDLLQHTSGIPDFTENPDLIDSWFTEPERVWTPEEVVALTDGMPQTFPPGSEFHWGYSNTNYVILGVLIEELEARPFHEVVRSRLLEPLDMESTYLEGFESGPAPMQGYFSPTFLPPAEPIDFAYTSIATSAWAAGGFVSTARDLHTLLSATLAGTVVSQDRIADMLEAPRAIPVDLFGLTASYGLGMQEFERFAGRRLDGFVGHIGDVPGYTIIAVHQRTGGTTIVWVTTSNVINPAPMLYPIAEAVANP